MLVRVDGGQWSSPDTLGYTSESDLQKLLAEQPGLLPGVTEGARAVTEFGTRVGPSDIVVVGVDGDITVVECKLASNEEARRKIVGQVFDYDARMWKMPLTEFEARWSQRAGDAFDSWLAPAGREQLESNLSAGRFRLILAVDTISEDLRRLVEYLNAHTLDSVQVLAIELSIAHAGNVDVLIPTVYGIEPVESVDRARAGQSSRWTVKDLIEWCANNSKDLAIAVETFLNRLQTAGCLLLGTSAQSPSLAVAVDGPDGRMWPYAIYTNPKPSLNINFAYLEKGGGVLQDKFLSRVAQALPELDADQIRADDYRRRPGVDLAALTRNGVIDILVHAVEGLGGLPN
ncbi:hypothetical protein [Nakamurella sp. PAMC28650]|uniref:hypothetical protein n=1 Tax=Nakamurella sp. PAMC28650 TaxID=2762325 RepID=UPI00164DBFD4|nr:hypothetical protein [Nakamurella sp. PAMC28650]QNK83248.1 hypothetical protein H7F38_11740 [Nakamurella sp. PAMC28650]